MQIQVFRDVLEHDSSFAERTRQELKEAGTLCINLIGAPGCGKTTLVRALIASAGERFRCGVMIGDIASALDAERLAPLEVPVVQLNTGGACHLEARLARRGFEALDLATLDIVIVENVGNLACPAEFDLGEDFKLSVVSVAEGDDKPLKYPLLFHHAGGHLLTKIDLQAFVDFDRQRFSEVLRAAGHDVPLFPVCAKTGDGMQPLIDWLQEKLLQKRQGSLPLPPFAKGARSAGHHHH